MVFVSLDLPVSRQLLPTQRFHYEVICEAAPCHLYFDLEFAVALNQSRDGIKMTRDFIEFVCCMILESFGISCSRENVLQLDSRFAVECFS